MNRKLSGVISALPTPFLNQKVDFDSLKSLVNFQIKNGVNGFVVNGTTAESPTLSAEEVEEIFKLVKSLCRNNELVILGTGSNSTQDTIEMSQHADKWGADAALVVVPYYNKPPQRGLVAHFSAVAKSINTQVILYNVPGRTITSMTVDTIKKLSEIKNITAIKEASGDMKLAEEIKKIVPESFSMLSGDDGTYDQFLKRGGAGIISVMSNVIPQKCVEWTKLAQDKSWESLHADFNQYKDFINSIYIEANPIPVKWMLKKMGIFKSAEMRLPLVELDTTQHSTVEKYMQQAGLL